MGNVKFVANKICVLFLKWNLLQKNVLHYYILKFNVNEGHMAKSYINLFEGIQTTQTFELTAT